jgi:hypothetical protein
LGPRNLRRQGPEAVEDTERLIAKPGRDQCTSQGAQQIRALRRCLCRHDQQHHRAVWLPVAQVEKTHAVQQIDGF